MLYWLYSCQGINLIGSAKMAFSLHIQHSINQDWFRATICPEPEATEALAAGGGS
jgi:hypothetical protein